MSQAEAIRSHVVALYVDPARHRGDQTVAVVAGEVHRALKLEQRVPNVCSALRTRKFLEANALELVDEAGPKSSTTTTFTYRLLPGLGGDGKPSNAIRELRGAGAETFAALGGGEHWLREEREAFRATESDGTAPRKPGSPE